MLMSLIANIRIVADSGLDMFYAMCHIIMMFSDFSRQNEQSILTLCQHFTHTMQYDAISVADTMSCGLFICLRRDERHAIWESAVGKHLAVNLAVIFIHQTCTVERKRALSCPFFYPSKTPNVLIMQRLREYASRTITAHHTKQ